MRRVKEREIRVTAKKSFGGVKIPSYIIHPPNPLMQGLHLPLSGKME